MNRRQFLASLMAVPAIAKAMMVTSHAPALVESDLITQILKTPLDGWQIHFPTGKVFEFQGVITSITRKAPVDSLITDTFSVRPTGPVKILEGRKQRRTTLSHDGKNVGELTGMTAPMVSREEIDVTRGNASESYVIPGIRRTGPMTFTVILDSE
jgi:hypothetical protein